MKTFAVVACALLALLLEQEVLATPSCPTQFAWSRDPTDCSVFYRCSWSRPYRFDCPSGLVFSNRIKNCVRPRGIYDDCNAGPVTLPPPTTTTTVRVGTISEQCAMGATLLPHPDQCQLYYNCNLQYDQVPRYFEQRLAECPYPKVFDRDTLSCRDFSMVSCDSRRVHKDGCEYLSNKCGGPHCSPCSFRLPPCLGLRDGMNPAQGREWTSNYVECRDERTVNVRQCTWDDDFQVSRMFDPQQRKCVNIYRVPTARGGAMPSCDRLFNGAYPIDGARNGTAYICQGQRLSAIRYCPVGSRPDPDPRACIYI